jgi:hypothetical protein
MTPARRVSAWEKTRQKKRKNRILKVIFLILALFIITNLAIKVPNLIKSFNQPFDKLSGDDHTEKDLNLSFRSNFLFISVSEEERILDTALLSYEPGEKRLTFVHLDLKRNRVLGRELKNLYKDKGIETLKKYVSRGLAIPVDRYIAVEDRDLSPEYISYIKRGAEDITFFVKVFSAEGIFGSDLKTDLARMEFINFLWKIRDSSFEEGDNISLENLKIRTLPNQQLTTLMEDRFLESKILEEGASVTVVNSSGEQGLAGVLTNYLTNLGASVVEMESSEEIVEESFLVIKNSKKSLENRLSYIFDFERKNKSEVDFAGDILIVLGKDAVEDLTLR